MNGDVDVDCWCIDDDDDDDNDDNGGEFDDGGDDGVDDDDGDEDIGDIWKLVPAVSPKWKKSHRDCNAEFHWLMVCMI